MATLPDRMRNFLATSFSASPAHVRNAACLSRTLNVFTRGCSGNPKRTKFTPSLAMLPKAVIVDPRITRRVRISRSFAVSERKSRRRSLDLPHRFVSVLLLPLCVPPRAVPSRPGSAHLALFPTDATSLSESMRAPIRLDANDRDRPAPSLFARKAWRIRWCARCLSPNDVIVSCHEMMALTGPGARLESSAIRLGSTQCESYFPEIRHAKVARTPASSMRSGGRSGQNLRPASRRALP